jgi:hypothetical protein
MDRQGQAETAPGQSSDIKQQVQHMFVDECSTNTSLTPLYAWSKRGERARCSTPRNWERTSPCSL